MEEESNAPLRGLELSAGAFLGSHRDKQLCCLHLNGGREVPPQCVGVPDGKSDMVPCRVCPGDVPAVRPAHRCKHLVGYPLLFLSHFCAMLWKKMPFLESWSNAVIVRLKRIIVRAIRAESLHAPETADPQNHSEKPFFLKEEVHCIRLK